MSTGWKYSSGQAFRAIPVRSAAVGEKEAPEPLSAVAHRRPLERLRAPRARGAAERAQVPREVRHAQRAWKVPQVLEDPRPVGPLDHRPALLGCKTGGDEVPDLAPLVERRDHAEPGAFSSRGRRSTRIRPVRLSLRAPCPQCSRARGVVRTVAGAAGRAGVGGAGDALSTALTKRSTSSVSHTASP